MIPEWLVERYANEPGTQQWAHEVLRRVERANSELIGAAQSLMTANTLGALGQAKAWMHQALEMRDVVYVLRCELIRYELSHDGPWHFPKEDIERWRRICIEGKS
jgi:hypothetical protein